MAVNPPMWLDIESKMINFNSSTPIIYARNKLEMKKDNAKNITCFAVFFKIYSLVQGPSLSLFCFGASPSIAYSILRKSISIKIV